MATRPATQSPIATTVYKHVDLDADSIDTPDLIPFSIAREPDIYYVQLRAMLYCFHNGN